MKVYVQRWLSFICVILLSVGITKALRDFNKLYGYTLDVHANEDAIRKEAEKRMREDVERRKEEAYWKEYWERKRAEEKDKK